MSRNGSGTASVINTFSPSTTISSSAVNANFSDIAADLTNSLALDGQSSMTGQFKAASGTAATPGMGFAADTNTGFYRKGSDDIGVAVGGSLLGNFDSNGLTLASGAFVGAVTGTLTGAWAYLPSGTKMLFQQTAAPTGWTKDTTHNNKALRVVSGTASSGGTVAFTTAFASQAVSGTVGNTTLDISQIPAHTHDISYKAYTAAGGADIASMSPATAYTATNTTMVQTKGGGGSHTHTFTGTAIDLAVQYVDIIICQKD